MAKAQLENGFTRIANEIIDALSSSDLKGRELRVFIAIIRETYGWNTKEKSITLSRIGELTRIDRRHVAGVVRSLLQRNMIRRNGITGIQTDVSLWSKVTPSTGAPPTVSKVAPPTVSPLLVKTIKDRKDSANTIPPSLEAVKNYCAERKNGIDPQRFIDYYQAIGWMRGKSKVKDWRACVRTWEQRNEPKKDTRRYL
jgi:phage replication O-like protein O